MLSRVHIDLVCVCAQAHMEVSIHYPQGGGRGDMLPKHAHTHLHVRVHACTHTHTRHTCQPLVRVKPLTSQSLAGWQAVSIRAAWKLPPVCAVGDQ